MMSIASMGMYASFADARPVPLGGALTLNLVQYVAARPDPIRDPIHVLIHDAIY
jgi:hypothetical protein